MVPHVSAGRGQIIEYETESFPRVVGARTCCAGILLSKGVVTGTRCHRPYGILAILLKQLRHAKETSRLLSVIRVPCSDESQVY